MGQPVESSARLCMGHPEEHLASLHVTLYRIQLAYVSSCIEFG